MTLTCVIRYEIDPFERDGFQKYAENWGRIIPRCGGHLAGCFLPQVGSDNVVWGLTAFDSLAAMAQRNRLILREERNFVELVEATFGLPAAAARGGDHLC